MCHAAKSQPSSSRSYFVRNAITEPRVKPFVETGYDLSRLPKARRGRPPVRADLGTVVPVRLDEATLAALIARAEAEGLATRSDAVRAAVRAWVRST